MHFKRTLRCFQTFDNLPNSAHAGEPVCDNRIGANGRSVHLGVSRRRWLDIGADNHVEQCARHTGLSAAARRRTCVVGVGQAAGTAPPASSCLKCISKPGASNAASSRGCASAARSPKNRRNSLKSLRGATGFDRATPLRRIRRRAFNGISGPSFPNRRVARRTPRYRHASGDDRRHRHSELAATRPRAFLTCVRSLAGRTGYRSAMLSEPSW